MWLLLACVQPPPHGRHPVRDGEVWVPPVGTTWQWQLAGNADLSLPVAAYDLDLFETPPADVTRLHDDGKVLICYFSAGSVERWRPDADAFPSGAIGEPLEGWPGERWLDVRDARVREVLLDRLDRAVETGCDAVEPDNVDGYQNRTGFELTRADTLDFLRFLSREAHARNLSVGLKNTVGLAGELVDAFDWTLNEECLSYDECGTLRPFLDADKAVLHVEYVDRAAQGEALRDRICGDPAIAGFSTLVKTWDLDDFVSTCE